MKQTTTLLRLLVALIAVTALAGCDGRLPRPGEPTTPQKIIQKVPSVSPDMVAGAVEYNVTHRVTRYLRIKVFPS